MADDFETSSFDSISVKSFPHDFSSGRRREWGTEGEGGRRSPPLSFSYGESASSGLRAFRRGWSGRRGATGLSSFTETVPTLDFLRQNGLGLKGERHDPSLVVTRASSASSTISEEFLRIDRADRSAHSQESDCCHDDRHAEIGASIDRVAVLEVVKEAPDKEKEQRDGGDGEVITTGTPDNEDAAQTGSPSAPRQLLSSPVSVGESSISATGPSTKGAPATSFGGPETGSLELEATMSQRRRQTTQPERDQRRVTDWLRETTAAATVAADKENEGNKSADSKAATIEAAYSQRPGGKGWKRGSRLVEGTFTEKEARALAEREARGLVEELSSLSLEPNNSVSEGEEQEEPEDDLDQKKGAREEQVRGFYTSVSEVFLHARANEEDNAIRQELERRFLDDASSVVSSVTETTERRVVWETSRTFPSSAMARETGEDVAWERESVVSSQPTREETISQRRKTVPSLFLEPIAWTREFLRQPIFMLTETTRHLQSSTAFRIIQRVFSLIGAILLFLLPVHPLLMIGAICLFSLPWGLSVGAVAFAYPHVFLRRSLKRKSIMIYLSISHTLCLPVFLWFGIPAVLFQFRKWDSMRLFAMPLVRQALEYFPLRVFRTEELDPDKKFVFCYHPHGVYVFGLLSAVFPEISGWAQLFPRMKPCFVGVANSLLCLPLVGDVCSWWGFLPASKENLTQAVRGDNNLVLVPGGIAEMLEQGSKGDKEEILYLRKRRGFVRLAIENGLSLVPVYGFGENRTFKRVSLLSTLRMTLSRRLRVTIQPFRGRYFTLIPFRQPLNVVVGAAIDPPSLTNGSVTEHAVKEMHERYIEAVRNLFEEHKATFGMEDVQLTIV